MNIDINNRLVMIIGPTTSGKSTLAKRIKDEYLSDAIIISHDIVLSKINKNQAQEKIDKDFRLEFLNEINNALNSDYSLIILDTVNVRMTALWATMTVIRDFIGYLDEITLLKLDIPLDLHYKFIENRKEFKIGYKKISPTTLLQGLFEQKKIFISENGSLFYQFPNTEEYIIQNPTKININFNLKKTK